MGDEKSVTTVAVVGLIVLCTVALAKWLALVAAAALVLVLALRVLVRWIVRRVNARRAGPSLVAVDTTPDDEEPACSWCGRPGGHHDRSGRPVRPRHAHVLPVRDAS